MQTEKDRAEYYLDMAGSLLVALDLSGRVTMLNHRGAEILGYTEEDLIGKDWVEAVVPPENRATARTRFFTTGVGANSVPQPVGGNGNSDPRRTAPDDRLDQQCPEKCPR